MNFPPDLVLFDCDGVLVDSEPLVEAAISANLSRRGLNLSPGQIGEMFLGGTMAGVAERARQMGADIGDDWTDEIYAEVFAVLEAEVEAIDGISVALDRLDAAGVGYAVCSNGPHAKMQITLARTGLLARFEGRIFSREDVATPKPAPDVYLLAATNAGIAPTRCVVIEDSANGARAGRAAGMYCLGYAGATESAKLRPICDAVFADMASLPGLLGL